MAGEMLRESLRLFQRRKSRSGCRLCLQLCSVLAAHHHKWALAARLIGACNATRAALGAAIKPVERAEISQLRAAVVGAMGESRTAEEEAAGKALSEPEVFALAIENVI
jgi:hypothetical protein